jgi:hypothetical protein
MAENSINLGHRIQLHHTAIFSTRATYMDRIIREWQRTISPWAPHPATPHCHPLHQTQIHGSHHQGVVEHSINWGHRIQLHHTAILSTRSRYMDRIIREWWSTVSTGGTASSYTTPPSSPPEPDKRIASSGSGGAQYQLGASHLATPHCHPLHQTQIHRSHHQGVVEHSINLGHRIQLHHTAILSTRARYTDRIIWEWQRTLSTGGTASATPHRHPLHQTQIHGLHHQGVAENSINWGHRIQLHHTAILSTRPRYTDRIIREWQRTVSTGGTASSYTTPPSSPPDPDTWIA